MSIKEWLSNISFKAWEWFSSNFDILQNIDIYNRITDKWFSEFNEMTIWPRAWTTLVWDRITWWTWWVSNQVFFVDFYKKIHHLKFYDKKVYELKNNSWTVVSWLSFTDNNIKTTSFLLPMNLDWSISTQYSAKDDSTWWERVKKDDNDNWWANAVGKFLIIKNELNMLYMIHWRVYFLKR